MMNTTAFAELIGMCAFAAGVVILVRILGPEAFGLAAMAMVFVLLAEFLVRETMTETIIQLEDSLQRDLSAWLQ